MRLVSAVLLLLAALGGSVAFGVRAAAGATLVRTPVDDVGFPFRCDWSNDWESRCYRDGPRLPVGGVDDKVSR
jgi:hypothetical protein